MAEGTLDERADKLLLPLERAASRRRSSRRQVGTKARALAKLLRAGLPVPEGWVLEARHFEDHLRRCLPPKHDIRTLIKLSGTGRGDDRCARAHEEILAAPPDEAIVQAVARLLEPQQAPQHRGVVVRASLAATGDLSWTAVRHLSAHGRLHTAEQVAQAIMALWADSVLAQVVADYARAELKDAAVAILIQREMDRSYEGVLTRTTGTAEPLAAADWHLGRPPPPDAVGPWQRWGMPLCPLSLGQGGESAPPAVQALRERLGDAGFEQLIVIGNEVEQQLGRGAELRFAVHSGHGEATQVYLLSAKPRARYRPLAGGDANTLWTELTLAGRPPEPPTRLTQSVLQRVVTGSLRAACTTLQAATESSAAVVTRWSSRSYLNLTTLAETAAAQPLLRPEDLLHAIGGAPPELMSALSGQAAAGHRGRWSAPLTVARALRQQLELQRTIRIRERTIESDSDALVDMELGLLPDDAVATTLVSAQSLVERAAELWSACAATLLQYQLLLQRLIRRHMPQADLRVGYTMQAGAAWSPAVAMASALQRTAAVVRDDSEATARLCAGRAGGTDDLPDGRARGAVGHFLSSWGHMCLHAFELSAPRWSEDARDAMHMLALLLHNPVPQLDPAALRQRARAAADAELARHEPELSSIERHLVRALLGRSKSLAERKASLDGLLWRVLAALRSVVLDVDRRLRRVDTSLPRGGVFHCSAGRLARALKSGHPELGPVIRMRLIERARERNEPAAPLSICGAAPVGAIPLLPQSELRGLGVSPGVVEGRARIVRGSLPARLEPDDVLVLPELDAALSPVVGLARAVVCESGGGLSLGAELCRAQSIPAVMSAVQASLQLVDGEPVRVDGDRGVVQRLAAHGVAHRMAPSSAPTTPHRSTDGAAERSGAA